MELKVNWQILWYWNVVGFAKNLWLKVFFVYEFKLLTADLRRSEQPPKQDVDFWSSLGRLATGFKLDLAPFVAVSLAVHSTSYYYSCY